MKFQIPKAKFQVRIKSQRSKFQARSREGLRRLEFERWPLALTWNLAFGFWNFPAR
jgi:hypothetical protein